LSIAGLACVAKPKPTSCKLLSNAGQAHHHTFINAFPTEQLPN
jgi:hypothetical protein